MKTTRSWIAARAILPCAALGFALATAADFEVKGPDGRRILLKDDKTWRYLDDQGAEKDKGAKDKGKATEASEQADKPKIAGEAVLVVERRVQLATGCMYALRLTNSFPHVIQSLFPTFSAVRASDVVYDSVSQGFQAVKPGDSQNREILFRGISCNDIARVQVSGGDRCVMGDLDRFNIDPGACLARVRVVASDLVRFDK